MVECASNNCVQIIHSELLLISLLRDEVPSESNLYGWFSEFNRRRGSLTNDFKEGRLKSVVMAEDINVVN